MMNRTLRCVLFASAIVGSGTVGHYYGYTAKAREPAPVTASIPKHPVCPLYASSLVQRFEYKQREDRAVKDRQHADTVEHYFQGLFQALCTALIRGENSASIPLTSEWKGSLEQYRKPIELRFQEHGMNVTVVTYDPFDDYLIVTLNKAE